MENPNLLTIKYSDKIKGILSCYDRIIIQGTIPGICYAEGMTSYLYANKIRIFDYRDLAQKWNAIIIKNAESLAEHAGLEIDYISKKNFRKEKKVKKILAERGNHPGLVHIFSALEPCICYKPWYDKKSGRSYLKTKSGRCLHYYFYFIDIQLGLCYMRVPAWAPFRLQFYFNGHNYLASQLKNKKIDFCLIENAFSNISNFKKAQNIANKITIEKIHRLLDKYAKKLCPVIEIFFQYYHWSIMQAEYATDIIFNSKEDLKPLYENIILTATHTVKPENIATFLGRKLHGNYQDEIGNAYNIRELGTRIRHNMGASSIKMYDKFGHILRIESSTYNVSFFKHFRKVEQRNGKSTMKIAPLKKSIYSLTILRDILQKANFRYLDFISMFNDKTVGIKKLNKISESKKNNNRNYRGFNFFDKNDMKLLIAISAGEYTISGFQNKNLREKIKNKNTGQISRIINRLRTHGLIKKIRNSYKYYLTKIGKQIITMGLKLREFYIIPELNGFTGYSSS
jgi:hypothetical protein